MPITHATKCLARYWQEKIYAAGIRDDNNYTLLSQPDRFYTGYEGEICFRNLLYIFNKRFKFEPRCDGYPDRHDFIVYLTGDPSPLTLNVKTAGQEYATHMMLPEAQFQKYQPDLYLGTRVRGNDAEMVFEGWTTHGILSLQTPIMHKTLTRKILFTKMRPTRSLLEMLE
jgi:hypothetical protein